MRLNVSIDLNDCAKCRFNVREENEHCYMFFTAPAERCGVFRHASAELKGVINAEDRTADEALKAAHAKRRAKAAKRLKQGSKQ